MCILAIFLGAILSGSQRRQSLGVSVLRQVRQYRRALHDLPPGVSRPTSRLKLDLAAARRGDGGRFTHRTGLALTRVGDGLECFPPAAGDASRTRDTGHFDVHIGRFF